MKFPKQIYARVEEDGSGSFLVTVENIDDFATAGEEVCVGQYQLVEEVVVTATVAIASGRVTNAATGKKPQ